MDLKPFVLCFLLLAIPALALNSTQGNFSVQPESISLNWSNPNETINITANSNNTQVKVNTYIPNAANYSQPYSDKYESCWIKGWPNFTVILLNQTGNETDRTKVLNKSEEDQLILKANFSCPPGRYWGLLNLTNLGNSSDWANISVRIDIPISPENELNLTTGKGYFTGKVEHDYYHSYYFNTSAVENATQVRIEPDGDIGVYLYDSGNLKADWVSGLVAWLEPGETWEIRLWGDGSYSADLWFSTLNLTNQSGEVRIIKAGVGPGENKTLNFTLKNEGNLSYSLKFSSELWHQKSFSSNQPGNFSFWVPDYAKEVRAILNWSGNSRYNLKLYSPSGLEGNSSEYWIYGNKTGGPRYEIVTAEAEGGWWKAEVENLTSPASFTLLLEYRVDGWISSDWQNGTKINQSDPEENLSIALKLPEDAVDGIYTGWIKLLGSNGLMVPIELNVSSGLLLVNGNAGSGTYYLLDNIGFNKTVTVNIPISNNGSQTITLTNSSSPSLKKGSYYINFTFSHPASLNPGESRNLQINFSLNTSHTGNSQGNYTGWIYLNGSSTYESFNLTIKLELTDELFVNVTQITQPQTPLNSSADENVTFTVKVCWINATWTNCTALEDLELDNFSAWIKAKPGWRYPESGYLETWKGSQPFPYEEENEKKYKINVTIPKNLPGGNYTGWIKAVWKQNGISYSGEGGNANLQINGTGLWFSGPSQLELDEDEWVKLNVTVINYGPVKAEGKLSLTGCSGKVDIDELETPGECGSFSDIDISEGETCWFLWNISAKAAGDCELKLTADAKYYEELIVDVTVNAVEDEERALQEEGGYAPYYAPELEISSYPGFLSGILNQTVYAIIKVKNTGNLSGTALASVTLEGVKAEIEPEECFIGQDQECSFNLSLTAEPGAKLGNRTGKFKVWIKGKEEIKDEVAFTFEVLPDEGRKQELNQSFQELNQSFQNLSQQFQVIKGKGFLNQTDIDKVEKLLNDSKELLDAIEAGISGGKWAEVEGKLEELNSTLARLEAELEKLGESQQAAEEAFWGGMWFWVLIGIIVAGFAGFIVYLFLPPKPGYHPKHGYRPKREKPHLRAKRALKEAHQRIRERAKKLRRKKGEFKYSYRA